MSRAERWLEEVAELTREYEQKLGAKDLVQSRLGWEDWETLRKQAVTYAEREIMCRKWRGSRGGTLPDGYDAESVASQVIEEMMSGKCKLAAGWTRERLLREIQRLVGQRVRVLHLRKEVGAMRSEWDQVNGDGERESLLKDAVAEGEEVSARVVEAEGEAWRAQVVREFGTMLQTEPELQAIFGCLCAGMEETKSIARELGMPETEVVKGRKKLVRRAGKFRRMLAGGEGRGRTVNLLYWHGKERKKR